MPTPNTARAAARQVKLVAAAGRACVLWLPPPSLDEAAAAAVSRPAGPAHSI